jgi:pimeloyl-ACP methyl ester carboxylesterase
MGEPERVTLVLVHSPLVGPLTWAATAECLQDKGYRVVVPDLVAMVEGGPPYYRRLADAVTSGVDSQTGVVVVGHSGAGALLPVIAEGVGARGAVFVDALLPHPGVSWSDTAPPALRERMAELTRDGRFPPWNEWFPAEAFEELLPDAGVRARFFAELPRVPVAYIEEAAPDVAGWVDVECAYVRLSGPYDDFAEEAVRLGWTVRREDADHLAMLTQPGRIADLIDEVVRGYWVTTSA